MLASSFRELFFFFLSFLSVGANSTIYDGRVTPATILANLKNCANWEKHHITSHHINWVLPFWLGFSLKIGKAEDLDPVFIIYVSLSLSFSFLVVLGISKGKDSVCVFFFYYYFILLL